MHWSSGSGETMDISNWAQAIAILDHPTERATPSARRCELCDRMSELADVKPNGMAFYVCTNQHETLVDVSRAMGLR